MTKVYSKEDNSLKVTIQKEEVLNYDYEWLKAERASLLDQRAWINAQIADFEKLISEAEKLWLDKVKKESDLQSEDDKL